MSTIWPGLVAPIDSQGPHAPTAFDTALPVDDGAVLLGDSILGHTIVGDGDVAELPRAITGFLRPSVNDTFYNRILIEPAQLQMGNLLTSQTRQIIVWNGFLSKKLLSNFQRTNADGITVQEPVLIPHMMRPLEQLNYVLNITTDGPAVIDASYTWTVDGEEYTATVTGRRVVIWPFGPSWDTPVTESLSWLTNVLRSFNGQEQRRGLRTKPRRTISYMFKVARDDSPRMENLLWGWQNRIYAVPLWTDRSRLTQSQSMGDLILNAPTNTYSFVAGGLAALRAGANNIEVVEIESVQNGSITIKRPLAADWAVGSHLYPVLLGHLPTRVPLMRFTSQAVAGTLTFETDPSTTDPYTPSQVAPTLYNGREVLMRQPNWISPQTNEFEYAFDRLDQLTGPITYDTTETFPRITRSYSWLLRNRTQIKDFRSMLGRLVGMQKSLYVPSWHDDFKITRPIGAADTAISVANNEFRLMVGNDPARNRLMIRLRDGTHFFRKIEGVSSDDTYTLISIDQSLGRPVAIDQVKTVHVLMCSRLATDQVDIVWRTDQAATVDTTFTTVLE